MRTLNKLRPGDKVAILSPSYAAPARWPHICERGLRNLREHFGLEPVEFPTTKELGSMQRDRAADLIAAFEDPSIRAVISTLGGDDQITYVKRLPIEPFAENPKPFFGFSDNTHFANHLWLAGVPSFYGGALFTQFATEDEFVFRYLRRALFEGGEYALESSPTFNEILLDWNDPANLDKPRVKEPAEGWIWDGSNSGQGRTWGGCLESIDELLRHGVQIPSQAEFASAILIAETSEEAPTPEYVHRVFRALGERGILECVRGILVGRPQAWSFERPLSQSERADYREKQRDTITRVVREYNLSIPIVQNMDFGHTNPQICMPYGSYACVNSHLREITVLF